MSGTSGPRAGAERIGRRPAATSGMIGSARLDGAGFNSAGLSRSRATALLTAVAMLVVLLFLPTASTTANFQTVLPASASPGGNAAWCITPDPATNPAVIRLSDVPPLTSAPTTRMAIVPVANTASWNSAGGNKTLGARVWSCQDPGAAAMVNDSLRVMGWSNPGTAAARTWLTGNDSTLGPTSRLDPNAGVLGPQLASLSTAASVSAQVVLLVPGGDLRRYVWMVGGNRNAATPAADPAQCTWATSLLLASCVVSTSAVGFASAFSPDPWAGATTGPVTYGGRTMATSSWGAGVAWLNQECGVLALLVCNPVPLAATLTATAAAPSALYGNTSGNSMLWAVVSWTGNSAPPPDLSVELVLQ